MERTRVNSSNISSIGYEEQSQTLEIEFNTGNVYQYYGVPPQVNQQLMNAASHGLFFSSNIKQGGYTYKKIK